VGTGFLQKAMRQQQHALRENGIGSYEFAHGRGYDRPPASWITAAHLARAMDLSTKSAA
jgi:hypothetical protein